MNECLALIFTWARNKGGTAEARFRPLYGAGAFLFGGLGIDGNFRNGFCGKAGETYRRRRIAFHLARDGWNVG